MANGQERKLRLIVCVKQVVDLDQVRMDRETREPILTDVPWVIGQLEKNALEEAARIKEKHQAEVVALSAGWPLSEEVVLECLARGADRAATLSDPGFESVSSPAMAMILARAIEKIGSYDLILVGEGATDNNSGQMGPALAQILGLPLVAYARQLKISDEKVRATRSLEDCFETVEVPLPLVVTVTAEINEPRIPSIIDVMDASAKPHDKWGLADIGFSPEELRSYAPVKTLKNQYPEQVRKNIMLKEESLDKSIDLLVQNLMKEGVLNI
ncbi:MAG: electron transfer flavoprotein subunit beta/FixA family protein [Chloroflexota bacterium]